MSKEYSRHRSGGKCILYLLHSIQTGSEANTFSYPMGTRGSFLGAKRPGREVDHSPPFNSEVKNGGATPPLPHMCSWYSA
jgi:hypothetical protein